MPMIQLKQLHDDPRNANVCTAETLDKIHRNIEKSGLYPPLIIRPHPKKAEHYIILDGHHRKRVLEKLGHSEVECHIWEVDEQGAQLALATLNRLRGVDEPRKRAILLQSLTEFMPMADLAQYIPESEKQMKDLLSLLKLDWDAAEEAIKKQIEKEQAEMPVPFVCMIAPSAFPDVEKAIALHDGADKGQKLVALCRQALIKEANDAEK